MKSKRALIIHFQDNVATVTEDVDVGDHISATLERDVQPVEAKEKIPFGFKVALTDIPKGDMVYKYGELVGKASKPISMGQLVHIHNAPAR
ncbi:MAG: UxaA family hydrolase [Candidatus Bathyarchaeota archaeon]|nr:UxaA family hydrolase [Candidatus Bathyarchaeota archaeon]